jgi:hypothetical protein
VTSLIIGKSLLYILGVKMNYIGGTNQALNFIAKYKKLGYVVDIYSDEWVGAQDPDEYFAITPEDLTKFDQEFGKKYRGHLLAVYLGDSNPELLQELRSIYKPFDDYCSIEPKGWAILNIPKLLFINLKTQEILCIGLGYKNRIYSFELSKYMNAYKNEMLDTVDLNCSEAFYELDHNNVVKNVLKTMDQLGDFYYQYDNLQGNADVLVTLNEGDGLYYFVDFDCDEGMTAEEVEELVAEYARYSEWIDDCEDDLKAYFPKLESWELNSGLY